MLLKRKRLSSSQPHTSRPSSYMYAGAYSVALSLWPQGMLAITTTPPDVI
jgi:hypothetical protein